MKTINKIGAQGDVLFRRVSAIPKGYAPAKEERAGRIIVGHSETGHHHAIDADGIVRFEGKDPLVCYLQLETVERCDVVHHRPWDTHETVSLGGGAGAIWEIRRQREYVPEGWRRVCD